MRIPSLRQARPAALLAALFLAGAGLLRPTFGAAPDEERLVLLGFDGADARTVGELVEAHPGRYPNFERLMGDGTFAPLEPVAPPESPVSWAAINTGQNPAKTGVPGFVKRVQGSAGPAADFGHIVPGKGALEDFDHTPVPAWSAGALAGATGVLAFVFFFLVFAVLLRLKVVLSGFVSLALAAVGGWCGYTVRGLLAEEYPRTGNPNQAQNFWEVLAEAEVDTVVLDAAQAFDMPGGGARVLAGLGVPDARGALGDWAIYTTEETFFQEGPDGHTEGLTAGRILRVFERDEGALESRVWGPANFWAEERHQKRIAKLDDKLSDPTLTYNESIELLDTRDVLRKELEEIQDNGTSVPLSIRLDRERQTARVRIGEEEQELEVGDWSEFYHLTFELNWLLKVHAITRVKLVQIEPHLELFLNVLDIDPAKPPFWQALSTPFAFSSELERGIGPFETYGWPTATMPFKDEVVSPELLMEDVEFTMKWRERLTYHSLSQGDWRVLMSVFSTTDRVQHMMYQYYDEGHPLYDEAEASKTFTFFGETISRRDAIPAIYAQMDRIIGTVIDEHLGPEDTLLVCSDHGFQSFRRQVHVNNWLAEQGYLTPKAALSKENSGSLALVDWSRTQAYSLGMGFIYLNLEGREARGIVDPAEAPELLARIKADLLAAEDEETGAKICNDVYLTSEIHSGPYLEQEADLIAGFAPTYRVSWHTTLGGLSVVDDGEGSLRLGPVCVDNDKTWSGGHISVALPDVAGVFFSNRKVEQPPDGFKSLHVAPTVLDRMGVAVPPEMDLAPLTIR